MWKPLVLSLGGLVAVLGIAGTAFTVAMRRKYPPVQDRVRRFNKAVMNPRQMDTAGQPGSWASLIHHVGRTSGRDYVTPVVTVPTDDGFWVALPYGTRADWVRNVLAAGGATIEHQGETDVVEHPELRDVAPAEDRMGQFFGVTQVLDLRTAVPATDRHRDAIAS